MNSAKAIKEMRAFNRFYTNRIGVVDRHILESQYSLTEVRILFEIYHDPHSTARVIKQFLRVDEGYLSRTLDKLRKQGLIIRKRSAKDGRSHFLSLSAKGEKEFLALNKRSQAAMGSMIKLLSPDETAELVSSLNRIQQLLTKEQRDER